MKKEFKEMLKERGRTEMPNVLLVSAECAPLSKTGGLADVVGTLPKALKKLGIDARVITPYHRCIKNKYADQVEHMFHFYSRLGWRNAYVGLEKLELDGVTIYLIDNEQYFGDKIYRGGNAEGEQYSFFCRAVLDVLPNLDFQVDVCHCNDWHTAIMPMLAHTQYRGWMQDKVKYLLTIHNIKFQGQYGFEFVQDLLEIDRSYYISDYLEQDGCANYMKAGCVFADRINTVSPSYAWEIKTPEYSEGLEGILNARSAQLTGIINGIDTKVFNPETDRNLPAKYSAAKIHPGKTQCKTALQKELGLPVNPDTPMMIMITRLAGHKGLDLLCYIARRLMWEENAQLVLIGTGEAQYETFFRELEEQFPEQVSAQITFNVGLAARVYAAGDIYLMPSKSEPCGLSQMNAMRYGTVPVVHATGGLKDTVPPCDEAGHTGLGFTFQSYNADDFYGAIKRCLNLYENDRAGFEALRKRDMEQDFGWDKPAEKYMDAFRKMLSW